MAVVCCRERSDGGQHTRLLPAVSVLKIIPFDITRYVM